jgi:hypothetical protein
MKNLKLSKAKPIKVRKLNEGTDLNISKDIYYNRDKSFEHKVVIYSGLIIIAILLFLSLS